MYLPNGLTDKEEKFVNAYLGEYGKEYWGNGTQSVLLAYNTTDENTAGVMAFELLRNPKIVNYINEYKRVKADSINESDIVNELLELRELTKKEGKYSDALRANELLGKWKAMFTDKQITQNETFEDVILKLSQKAKKGAENEAESKSKSEIEPAKESLPAPIYNDKGNVKVND